MLPPDVLVCNESALIDVEKTQAEIIDLTHKYDNFAILIYVILVIVSVLTIWFFKHHRIRFTHSTTMSILYGFIVGIVIHYNTEQSMPTVANSRLLNSTSSCNILPPRDLYLEVPYLLNTSNSTESRLLIYHYSYLSQIYANKTQSTSLQKKTLFNSEIFFNILLPPIIFTAGYTMERKNFFKNIGAIALYAFFGTLISSVVVGFLCYKLSNFFSIYMGDLTLSSCLSYGSLISATDPVTVLSIFNDLSVDSTLYALVFGESILNDAVAMVLSESIDHYATQTIAESELQAILGAALHFFVVFFGACLLGIAIGSLTAMLTKFTHVRDYPLLETSLFTLMSYATFLVAECLSVSGIVGVLFCGITQAHYTYNNLSAESKEWTKQVFEMLNFVAENFLFAYMGVAVFNFGEHNWNPAFIGVALFACLVGRICNVYFISMIANWFREKRITFTMQHVMLWSGLRGAMAFALSIRNTTTLERQMFFSTTLVIVMFSVIVIGSLTAPLLTLCNTNITDYSHEHLSNKMQPSDSTLENFSDQDEHFNLSCSKSHDVPGAGASVVHVFTEIDRRFLTPLLTNSGPLLSETLPQCCITFASLFTTDEQLIHCTTSSSYVIHDHLHSAYESHLDRHGRCALRSEGHMNPMYFLENALTNSDD